VFPICIGLAIVCFITGFLVGITLEKAITINILDESIKRLDTAINKSLEQLETT